MLDLGTYLYRLSKKYPKIIRSTTKKLWTAFVQNKRIPTHNQVQNILARIEDSNLHVPIQDRIWKICTNKKYSTCTLHILHINPIACPRPRITKYGRAYMTKKYVDYKNDLINQLQKYEPISGKLIFDVDFYFYNKNKAYGYHKSRPDIDNLLKGVFDAYQQAKIIEDDQNIVGVISNKYWSHTPKITVTIYKLQENHENNST